MDHPITVTNVTKVSSHTIAPTNTEPLLQKLQLVTELCGEFVDVATRAVRFEILAQLRIGRENTIPESSCWTIISIAVQHTFNRVEPSVQEVWR